MSRIELTISLFPMTSWKQMILPGPPWFIDRDLISRQTGYTLAFHAYFFILFHFTSQELHIVSSKQVKEYAYPLARL